MIIGTCIHNANGYTYTNYDVCVLNVYKVYLLYVLYEKVRIKLTVNRQIFCAQKLQAGVNAEPQLL